MRTKDGLKAAKADGKLLGRPKGSKSRHRKLAPFHDQIKGYLALGISLTPILKIINNQLPEPVTYNTLKYYVTSEATLYPLLRGERPAIKSARPQPDHLLLPVDDLEGQVRPDLHHDHVDGVGADVDSCNPHLFRLSPLSSECSAVS